MTSSVIRIMAILEAESITGPAKAVLEFAREARSSSNPRIELSILTFLRGAEENMFIRRVRDENIPLDIVREQGRFDRSVIDRLREAVARRKPHIIWTNAVKSHFLVRASGLHKQARWVAFHHGYTTTDWATRMYNQLDRWSHPGARRVVTVCEAFARLIEKRGVARERIRVEYMPIRPSTERPPRARQTLRSHLQIEAGTIVLLSVGRLSKEKGHAELVRAVARIHRTEPALPIRLLLVGDGPEAAPLKALCRELKIESRVLFAGHQATVRDYYAAADIFVLPSHSEGSPNVLLEAIDADLPIVATAVGGISEMVGNEVEALLVRRGDGEALAGAITRLVHDEALRERLKSAGRKLLDRHTPEKFFRNLATIFREVADSGP